MNEKRTDGPRWDAYSIRELRRHLEMTQQEMSDELGVRQQTISDWECGYHQPRGGMSRLLSIIAERAGYEYNTTSDIGYFDPDELSKPSTPETKES